MSRTAKAEELCSVRLPAGLKSRVMAASGQPFSRVVRFMCEAYVKAREAELASTRSTPDAEEQNRVG